MTDARAGHDIVVIGASAGGIGALSAIASRLPADLPAAVFIAVHTDGFFSRLPDTLSSRSSLRVAHALHGETIAPGRIYVAPPDNHLVIHPGYVSVTRGPKENGHRPSIDVLFRTAAKSYESRVIGVVLTGHLDCGTAGLTSVKARSGIAVAQDPKDAAAPDMPQNAIDHVAIDHVARLTEIPELLTRLVVEPPAALPAHLPGALAQIEGDEPGTACELVCPDCNGKLTVSQLGAVQRFHCQVGHAFSTASIAAAQSEQVERALWSSVRALEEGAALARRLAAASTGRLRGRFEERSLAQAEQARLIRDALLAGLTLSPQGGLAEPFRIEGWSERGADPGSMGEPAMTDQKRWKGDAVAGAPPGESEAAADRVAGREASAHPRESPPANRGRYQPRKLSPEDAREIEEEKRQAAVEQHAEDRQTGNGTAPKNL
jgi:two-component system chemotaxis response regulator CheB